MFEKEMQINVVVVVVTFAFDQGSPFGPPSDRAVGYNKLKFFLDGGRGGGGICRSTV